MRDDDRYERGADVALVNQDFIANQRQKRPRREAHGRQYGRKWNHADQVDRESEIVEQFAASLADDRDDVGERIGQRHQVVEHRNHARDRFQSIDVHVAMRHADQPRVETFAGCDDVVRMNIGQPRVACSYSAPGRSFWSAMLSGFLFVVRFSARGRRPTLLMSRTPASDTRHFTDD
ncbi:hypothetical protein [Burkholderia seminalis]|uniref:hypothetical protein n=1 Tax=Burkholderia seminalis TaxID=488731 RepID=UPI003F51288B